ncbi:MAG: chemotaxis protein CheB, partial [Phormidesmis sp.]
MTNRSLNSEAIAKAHASFPVVGIGASAGGIEACSTLLRELPKDGGIAYVVIQHLGANSPSMLSQILARETDLSVAEAKHNAVVEPNRVYVIPPNIRMTIAQGRLQLAPREVSDRPFKSIDIFFKSLAADCRSHAIGVVLSGLDGDGAEGLRRIKETGGVTFAQTENSAEFSSMPITAAETGQVDFILPPAEIARQIVKIAQHPYISEPDGFQLSSASETDSKTDSKTDSESSLTSLYSLLKVSTGVDFSQYKRATFERRLKRRMALYRISSLETYIKHLKNSPVELDALYHDVLIKVTSFFRDAETFDFLKQVIFPALIEQKGLDDSVRIWVAGCATGEECYSLAISLFEFLSEQNLNLSIQIFGTDVDEAVVDVARRGIYPESRMEGVSAERRSRFFVHADGHYQISKAVRELCVFARQN